MTSAFDDLDPYTAEFIRKRLLAGDTMASIRSGMEGISAKLMRELRDEVFEPLIADPEAVKALAAGACLNPLEIVRYRRRPGKPARTARPLPTQAEMFPA